MLRAGCFFCFFWTHERSDVAFDARRLRYVVSATMEAEVWRSFVWVLLCGFSRFAGGNWWEGLVCMARLQ